MKNKWLTAVEGGRVTWTDDKLEPNSCWQAVAKCGNTGYVQLKNRGTGRYLSVEYKALFAKSQTSKENDKAFCWGLVTKTDGAKSTKKTQKPTKKPSKKPAGRGVAFESLSTKNWVPAADASWASPASPSLVVGGVRAYLQTPQLCKASGSTFYTIVDNSGRRLIDGGGGQVYWSSNSRDNTCWQIISGGCGNSKYYKLKSSTSGRYLRIKGNAMKLETNANNTDFCWKM